MWCLQQVIRCRIFLGTSSFIVRSNNALVHGEASSAERRNRHALLIQFWQSFEELFCRNRNNRIIGRVYELLVSEFQFSIVLGISTESRNFGVFMVSVTPIRSVKKWLELKQPDFFSSSRCPWFFSMSIARALRATWGRDIRSRFSPGSCNTPLVGDVSVFDLKSDVLQVECLGRGSRCNVF